MNEDGKLTMFVIILGIGFVWAGICGWYFLTHCWNVPVAQMTTQCALLIYTSK